MSITKELLQAIIDGKDIEVMDFFTNSWKLTYQPIDDLDKGRQLRIAVPKENKIQLGNRFFPKPETSKLIDGTKYFTPSLTSRSRYLAFTWDGSEYDMMNLTRGIVHLNPDAAIEQGMALIDISISACYVEK